MYFFCAARYVLLWTESRFICCRCLFPNWAYPNRLRLNANPSLHTPRRGLRLLSIKVLAFHGGHSGFHIVIIENLGIPVDKKKEKGEGVSALLPHGRFGSDDHLWIHLHHYFPCVHGQIGVIKTPIKLLLGNRFVAGVVVGAEILVRQGWCGRNALLGVKHEHAFEQINRCGFNVRNAQ